MKKSERDILEQLLNGNRSSVPVKTSPNPKAIKSAPANKRNSAGLAKAIQNNGRMSEAAKKKALATLQKPKGVTPLNIKKPRVKKNEVIEIEDE